MIKLCRVLICLNALLGFGGTLAAQECLTAEQVRQRGEVVAEFQAHNAINTIRADWLKNYIVLRTSAQGDVQLWSKDNSARRQCFTPDSAGMNWISVDSTSRDILPLKQMGGELPGTISICANGKNGKWPQCMSLLVTMQQTDRKIRPVAAYQMVLYYDAAGRPVFRDPVLRVLAMDSEGMLHIFAMQYPDGKSVHRKSDRILNGNNLRTFAAKTQLPANAAQPVKGPDYTSLLSIPMLKKLPRVTPTENCVTVAMLASNKLYSLAGDLSQRVAIIEDAGNGKWSLSLANANTGTECIARLATGTDAQVFDITASANPFLKAQLPDFPVGIRSNCDYFSLNNAMRGLEHPQCTALDFLISQRHQLGWRPAFIGNYRDAQGNPFKLLILAQNNGAKFEIYQVGNDTTAMVLAQGTRFRFAPHVEQSFVPVRQKLQIALANAENERLSAERAALLKQFGDFAKRPSNRANFRGIVVGETSEAEGAKLLKARTAKSAWKKEDVSTALNPAVKIRCFPYTSIFNGNDKELFGIQTFTECLFVIDGIVRGVKLMTDNDGNGDNPFGALSAMLRQGFTKIETRRKQDDEGRWFSTNFYRKGDLELVVSVGDTRSTGGSYYVNKYGERVPYILDQSPETVQTVSICVFDYSLWKSLSRGQACTYQSN